MYIDAPSYHLRVVPYLVTLGLTQFYWATQARCSTESFTVIGVLAVSLSKFIEACAVRTFAFS